MRPQSKGDAILRSTNKRRARRRHLVFRELLESPREEGIHEGVTAALEVCQFGVGPPAANEGYRVIEVDPAHQVAKDGVLSGTAAKIPKGGKVFLPFLLQ